MKSLWKCGVTGALAMAVGLLMSAVAPALAQEAAPSPPALPEPHPDMPAEFKQLLPRGHIASVDAPQFVTAAEAEISEDAWVLGVVVEGQARAYSLNLLNRHEVVNDHVGDTAFAAVW
jgi:ABC-type sugar transport system substrate-binding protein